MADLNLEDLLVAKFLFVVGFAALVAMVVNWIDPPTTKLSNAQEWVISISGTVVAAFLVAGNSLASGANIYEWNGFINVVIGSLGGIVTVRAILKSKYLTPQSSPGPPA